jgi:hypothetical protein
MARRKLVEGIWLTGTVTTTDSTNWILVASFDMTSNGAPPDKVAAADCVVFCEGKLMGWESATFQRGAVLVGMRSFHYVSGTLIGIESDPGAQIYQAVYASIVATFSIRIHDSIASTIAFYVRGTSSKTIDWIGDMKISLWQPS